MKKIITITRTSNTSATETVTYRTVSLSAIDGQHFTGSSGDLVFDADNNTRKVNVTERTPSIEAYKYQTGTTRKYRFEVQDKGGFRLAHIDRTITTGKSISTSAFDEKNVVIQANAYSADDGGYDNSHNGYKSVDSSYFFNTNNAVSRAYYKSAGAQLRMTLSFYAMEEDDAYQYLQLLFDEKTNCDNRNDCSNGNPGNINLSSYMAGFEIYTGETDSDYKKYTFPITSIGNNEDPVPNPWGYTTSDKKYPLDKQKFNTDCRASDGRIIVPSDFKDIVLRLNASGSKGSDRWWAKNVTAHIQAVDEKAPKVLTGYRVSGGKHAKGNTVYISVPFSEVVTVSGTVTIQTTWGNFDYLAGSGTNVLTFSGTIKSNASGTLVVNGYSGVIKDMNGNQLNTVYTTIYHDFGTTLDATTTYSISYDLAGGSVATDNPTTYTYETATFTLNNPTRLGYFFNGWTGSNGTTPQTIVTVNTHSHGDRTYTANWTDAWGMSSEADGSQAHPYTITTPEGLILLADMVNNTEEGFSGKYFQLGADIDMNGYAFMQIGIGLVSNIGHYFYGVFNGQGHIISNLSINSSKSYVGLFGYLFGTVENVIVDGANITGQNAVAAVAGRVSGYVKNCHVFNSTITGSGHVGAIAGQIASASRVSNSYYRNCTVNGDTGSDLFTITTTGNVTATATPNITYNSVDYYASGQTVTLGYSGISEGYTITYTATDEDDGDITSSVISGNILTIRENDVTISATATRNPISTNYIDAEGNSQTVTAQPLEGGETKLGVNGQETWYVVNSNISYDHQVGLKGNVHLILCDGYTMTMTETGANNQCIRGDEKNLTIYGQSGGSGVLNVTSSNSAAILAGILTINGGTVVADAKYDALYGARGVTINGGVITATSSNQIAVDTDPRNNASITINGGVLKANGQMNGFVAYEVIINGGQVETSGIRGNYIVVLGYRNASDRIKSGNYYAPSIKIADGQTMKDEDGNTYSGTLTSSQIEDIARKTLQPDIFVSVDYIDAEGNAQTTSAIPLTGMETELGVLGQDSWYVVNGNISYGHQVNMKGNVNLILSDGKTMIVNVSEDGAHCINSENLEYLTFYGQDGGTGALTLTNTGSGGSCIQSSNLNINGGQITATAAGAALLTNYFLTINGGTVKANINNTNVSQPGLSGYCITIGGGLVETNGMYIMDQDGSIVLGYRNAGDRIKSGNYSASSVKIADGQTMKDEDGNTYSGTLNSSQIEAIAGKTLQPDNFVCVDYIDAEGNTRTATAIVLSGTETTLGYENQQRWYVVNSDISYDHQVGLKGNVHLILCDGKTMTMTETDANKQCLRGLWADGSNLTIYGQSGGTGALTQTNTGSGGSCIQSSNLTINGGHITASAEAKTLYANNLTINGGHITASAEAYALYANGILTINGGVVKATTTVEGSYGFCVSNAEGACVVINGGQVETSGIDNSSGTVTLGYSYADDYIKCDKYSHPYYIQIAEGKTMTDEYGNTYSGSVNPVDIAGKTLRPYIAESPNITLVQGEKGGVTCYWGTFYSIQRYTLPDGAAAYTMGPDHKLYRLGTDGSVIPAGVAVVIIAEESALTQPNSISLTKSNDTSEVSIHGGSNILRGSDCAIEVTEGKITVGGRQKTPYVLSVKNNTVDFYPLSSSFTGSIPAHKAYYLK